MKSIFFILICLFSLNLSAQVIPGDEMDPISNDDESTKVPPTDMDIGEDMFPDPTAQDVIPISDPGPGGMDIVRNFPKLKMEKDDFEILKIWSSINANAQSSKTRYSIWFKVKSESGKEQDVSFYTNDLAEMSYLMETINDQNRNFKYIWVTKDMKLLQFHWE